MQIKNQLAKHEKSPLRYPGGKSRAVKQIMWLIPNNVTTLLSPFFGGGSVELTCARQGVRVYGFDAFAPLVNFWQETIADAKAVAQEATKYYPLQKPEFYEIQNNYTLISDNTQRAAMFYVLNRASFSGTTFSGGMSPKHPRFTLNSLKHLGLFRTTNLTVECASWQESINRQANSFMYLDPPYANKKSLYGVNGDMHKGFNHEELAEVLSKKENWLLSYNDCALVRSLYKENAFVKVDWSYGIKNKKASNEVLILSNDLILSISSDLI